MKLDGVLELVYKNGLNGSMDMKDIIVNNMADSVSKIPYMRQVFSKYFSECFIDGYYGETEALDDYIKEMHAKILKEIGNLKNLLNISSIMNRIPSEIHSCLSIDNVFLAGGAALKVILNKDWNGDWDIYCQQKAASLLIDNVLKKSPNQDLVTKCSRNQYGSWNININDKKIQLIIVDRFATPLDITSNFDLTICQFAISRNIPCIHGPDIAFSDMQSGLLRLNSNLSFTDDKNKLKQRISKYLSRGFIETEDLINSINKVQVKFPKIKKRKIMHTSLELPMPNFFVAPEPEAAVGQYDGYDEAEVVEEQSYAQEVQPQIVYNEPHFYIPHPQNFPGLIQTPIQLAEPGQGDF